MTLLCLDVCEICGDSRIDPEPWFLLIPDSGGRSLQVVFWDTVEADRPDALKFCSVTHVQQFLQDWLAFSEIPWSCPVVGCSSLLLGMTAEQEAHLRHALMPTVLIGPAHLSSGFAYGRERMLSLLDTFEPAVPGSPLYWKTDDKPVFDA